MKRTTRLLIALALGASALTLPAQFAYTTGGQAPAGGPGGGRGFGPRGPQHGSPPIIAVLDANQDRTLDQTELANAPAALLTLDQDKDGALSRTELCPRGGPRGPRGQIQPSQEPQNPPLPRCPALGALDTDRDGSLSAPEIAAAEAALLTLDGNQDGQLTSEEILPRPQGPPMFAALDANRDGVLDAAEIANAPAALIALDANKDGQLTREELGPVGHMGGGRGFGWGAMRHEQAPAGSRIAPAPGQNQPLRRQAAPPAAPRGPRSR